MRDETWYLVLMVVISLGSQVLKSWQKRKKRLKSTQTNSSESVGTFGDTSEEAAMESVEDDGRKREELVESHATEENGVVDNLLNQLVHSLREEKSDKDEIIRPRREEVQAEERTQRGLYESQRVESQGGEKDEVSGDGVSSIGYEAGGGVIRDLDFPLGGVPGQEGGEGLATQRAEELQHAGGQEAEAGKLAEGLGISVMRDARSAMIATFILEPKFKRRGKSYR